MNNAIRDAQPVIDGMLEGLKPVLPADVVAQLQALRNAGHGDRIALALCALLGIADASDVAFELQFKAGLPIARDAAVVLLSVVTFLDETRKRMEAGKPRSEA